MSTEYKALTTLSGHREAVNAFAFNSTGTRMASGGDDGLLIIWNISKPSSCTVVQTISEPYQRWGQITTIAIPPPAGSAGYPIESVIFGTGRGYVCQWREIESGGRLEEVHGQAHFAINDPVEAVACNANDQLVTTTHSGAIACFNTAKKNWERLWRFDLRNAIPHAVTFDPTGAKVNVFALESGEQYTFTTKDGTFLELRQLKSPIGYASASPDGHSILVDSIVGPFEIYSTSSSSPSTSLSASAPITSLSKPRGSLRAKSVVKQGVFGEGGKVAVCGSTDGRLFVYALVAKKCHQLMPTQVLNHNTRSAVQAVATFSFPERHLIVSAPTQEDSVITVWSRDRTIQDTPLQADDQEEDDVPGRLPVLEPETEVTPISVLIIALIVAGIATWFHGISIDDIVNGAQNVTEALNNTVKETLVALVGERVRQRQPSDGAFADTLEFMPLAEL